MTKISETDSTCNVQLSLNSDFDSAVDSGSIWLNISKWNMRLYRKKECTADTIPHSFTFSEICVNLSVDFYGSKTEHSTPVLDWIVPAEGQQEFAKQKPLETQLFQIP